MEDEIIEQLAELVEKWEDEREQLDALIQSYPEIEDSCSVKKETLEEVIREINFVISEFTIVD